MVVRKRQEGERWEQNTRKFTDKNGAAKRGQTADEEKKLRRGDFVATASVVLRPLVRQNPALSFLFIARGFAPL